MIYARRVKQNTVHGDWLSSSSSALSRNLRLVDDAKFLHVMEQVERAGRDTLVVFVELFADWAKTPPPGDTINSFYVF